MTLRVFAPISPAYLHLIQARCRGWSFVLREIPAGLVCREADREQCSAMHEARARESRAN